MLFDPGPATRAITPTYVSAETVAPIPEAAKTGISAGWPRTLRLRGQRPYPWGAMDRDGDVLDTLVTRRQDAGAAKRLIRRLLMRSQAAPCQLASDRLRGYAAARREVGPCALRRTGWYRNNRAVVSFQRAKVRVRQMRRFNFDAHVQRSPSVQGPIQNPFRAARHRLKRCATAGALRGGAPAWEDAT